VASISVSQEQRRSSLVLLTIAFVGFICLGLADTLRDVAFPSIRSTFGVPLDSLGVLLAFATAGYTVASFISGQVISRLGVGQATALSFLLRAVGLFGYAIAPEWGWMLVCALIAGAGGGLIDSGLNIYVAANHGPTPMFWLHACFGIGATLGPLIMTAVLRASQPWQVGYVIGGLLQVALMLAFIVTAPRWQVQHSGDQREKPKRTPMFSTLRLPMVWISILLFLLYAGAEVAASVWSYALFVEGRGIAPEVAGVWISIYWGSFTIGRIFAGLISKVMNETVFLRLSTIGALICGALMWWNPSELVSLIGLAGFGYALAPIFPALITSTKERVGEAHASNTIGFQIGAASLGIAFVPGLMGVLAENISLEIVPIALTVVAFGILALHELILWRGRAF
jgi:fucose permease